MGLFWAKYARRIFAIVSTTSIPDLAPVSPTEATVDPPSRGSRLDADHPENGVLIPCVSTQSLQRHSDRPRPADLDGTIDAAAIGQLAHLRVPIGRLGVVDHIGSPQRLEPLGLLDGRSRRDHPSAQDPGEL